MFIDQAKFTANTARRTHAQVDLVAREQDELTNDVLRLTRGVLLKDTGDGCFAQFPSVLDAVRAGVLLQRRLTGRNAAEPNELIRFELHIGVDVGELVVLRNGDLRGEAANRCARICSECPAGEVYLSDTAAGMLKDNEVELELVSALSLKGIEVETRIYRVHVLHSKPEDPFNPFIWRGGITRADDFFNRESEQQRLRTYLRGRQSCQIVDPNRLGKTSLLYHLVRTSPSWHEPTTIGYVDMQHPSCFTLAGWLDQASRALQWIPSITTLIDFAERVEEALSGGTHLVLCLDDFDELALRGSEFDRDFFVALRSCGRLGMSMITASKKPLSSIAILDDPTSPLYNIFSLLPLNRFTDSDAQRFITSYRWGVEPFLPEETAAILRFAKGHPLAIQIACFHLLETRHVCEAVSIATAHAEEEMKVLLPSGW
jgi:hypothetical protein